MNRNPVLDQPLAEFMRPEIALILQRVLHIHDVESLLQAWSSAKGQKNIEQVFDNPQQARHAVAVCSAWLGNRTQATLGLGWRAWWAEEDAGRAASM